MTTNDLVKQCCYIVDGFKGELIDILVFLNFKALRKKFLVLILREKNDFNLKYFLIRELS